MTKEFGSWTEYDDWLIENYNEFAVYRIGEAADGKITAEFRDKAVKEEKEGRD